MIKSLTKNSFLTSKLSSNLLVPSVWNCTYAKKKNDSNLELSLQEGSFKTHKLDMPELIAETNPEELKDFFYQMSVIRKMEVLADGLYKQKLIKGFLHLYNGQEAICVGMEGAMRKSDHIITAYRDHGFYYSRGGQVSQVIGELLGNSSGSQAGKGGSMHMYSKKNNFHGGNGIVGAHIPVGTGLAYSEKYKGTDNIAVALYGDGAANQGQLYESFNMASIWKLPMVFICENNHFGMGTSIERSSAVTEHFTRGDNIPGIQIDGMNVLAVKTGFKHAAEFARKNGPIVVEFNTYRYVGHSMSDPGTTYRTKEDVKKVREERDPISSLKNLLIENNIATADELKNLDKKAKEEVAEGEKIARAAQDPSLDELYANIYLEDTFARGVELSQSYNPK